MSRSIRRVEIAGLPDGLRPYWVAFEYASTGGSAKAWERAQRTLEGVSVWRFQNPEATRFFCIALGERREHVERSEACLKKGSVGEFDPPYGMLEALTRRRLGMALESLGKDEPELRQESRTPEGRILLPDGRMLPYKPPNRED